MEDESQEVEMINTSRAASKSKRSKALSMTAPKIG
jgi:hypothetical protein